MVGWGWVGYKPHNSHIYIIYMILYILNSIFQLPTLPTIPLILYIYIYIYIYIINIITNNPNRCQNYGVSDFFSPAPKWISPAPTHFTCPINQYFDVFFLFCVVIFVTRGFFFVFFFLESLVSNTSFCLKLFLVLGGIFIGSSKRSIYLFI